MRSLRCILLLFQLVLSNLVLSQVEDEWRGELDLDFFVQKYDSCDSKEALDFVYEINDSELVKKEHIQLNAIAYAKSISRIGDHTKALEALSLIRGQVESSSHYIQGEFYGALGGISYSSESPVEAETYLLKSVKYLKRTHKKGELQAKYISLGMVATALEDYEKAKEYYTKAHDLVKYGSNKSNLYLQLNMALTESNSGNYEYAKRYFLGALELFKTAPDVYAEIRTYGNLGDIYVRQDSLVFAEELYTKGLNLAEKKGFLLEGVRFNLSLSDLHAKLNNYPLAYNHRLVYDSLRSALELDQVAREMKDLEKQHEIHLKNIEISAQQERNTILGISAVILLLLVLFLVFQWRALQQKNKVLLKKITSAKEHRKSKKPLSNDKQVLIDNLEKLMNDGKFFKNPNVNLERTAKKLNSNRSYLSEAINDCYEIGFSRLLNDLRVHESLELLSNVKYDKYSIEGIANMVGFSSISSFNANFKSITGITPSYFRKNRTTHLKTGS